MAYQTRVPGQIAAEYYLTRAAQATDRPLRVTGHSKGGNLAVYAAASVAPEVQDRIVSLQVYDGPGMNREISQAEGYLRIREKIRFLLLPVQGTQGPGQVLEIAVSVLPLKFVYDHLQLFLPEDEDQVRSEAADCHLFRRNHDRPVLQDAFDHVFAFQGLNLLGIHPPADPVAKAE